MAAYRRWRARQMMRWAVRLRQADPLRWGIHLTAVQCRAIERRAAKWYVDAFAAEVARR